MATRAPPLGVARPTGSGRVGVVTMVLLMVAGVAQVTAGDGSPSQEQCPLCTRQLGSTKPSGTGEGTCSCTRYMYMTTVDKEGSDGTGRRAEAVGGYYTIDECRNLRAVPNFTAVCGASNILSLSLNSNSLRSVGDAAFSGLRLPDNDRYRSEIRLANASLRSLSPRAFDGMRGQLRLLDLSHNQLSFIPAAVYGLTTLQKLVLSHNRLTLEQLHGESISRGERGELHQLQHVDLSYNQLDGVPDLTPTFNGDNSTDGGGPATNPIQELRLHGNPIMRDLSTFADVLVGYSNLEKVTWPQATMTCSCYTLVKIAQKVLPEYDFTFRVIYPKSGGNGSVPARAGSHRSAPDRDDFIEWEATVCDAGSVVEFIGRPIGLISKEEIRKACREEVRHIFVDEDDIENTADEAYEEDGPDTEVRPDSGYTILESPREQPKGGKKDAMAGAAQAVAVPIRYLIIAFLLLTVLVIS